MSAREVAQSVPPRFWHGPDSMVAPHLPVGSPERAALFEKLRETFDEDWAAAERAVEAERLRKKGHLYFITCGDAVKIGRTINISERLRNMQVNSPHEMDCLLLLRGEGPNEAKWHKRFERHRIRGEWFRLAPDLKAAILDARRGQADAPNDA